MTEMWQAAPSMSIQKDSHEVEVFSEKDDRSGDPMRREGLMVGKYHAWLSSTITGAAHLALSVECMDAGCDLATIAAAVHRVGRQAHAGWLPIKVSTVTCVRLSGKQRFDDTTLPVQFFFEHCSVWFAAPI